MLSLFSTTFAVAFDANGPVLGRVARARRSPLRVGGRARTVQLLAGLVAVGVGAGLVISAGLGVASWDVLNLALVGLSGLPLGVVVVAAGLLALVGAAALGRRPSWGTFTPLLVVSPVLDLTVRVGVEPQHLWTRLVLLGVGMVVLAAGIGAYIGAERGAGPADLLFLALVGRGLPVWSARVAIDAVTGGAGWLLGGPVGLGTVIITVSMGPLVAVSLRLFDLAPARHGSHRVPVHALTEPAVV